MTYRRPETGRTTHIVTKRQEYSSAYTLQRTSYDNSYFPLPTQTHSLPYHYAFPYDYAYPYTYYPNPYYPSYSYFPPSYGEIVADQRFQNMGSKRLNNELIEQSRPVQIKIEPQEQPKLEEKSAQKVILINKKKEVTTQKTFERKDYKRKDNLKNQQVKYIFNRLIRTFISQDPSLNREKAEIKKCLKQTLQIEGFDEFFDLVFQNLKKKFADFRKTKQEMIKYIIRRTYHNHKMSKGGQYRPELDRLQQFHEKNLSLFKSMNSDFLRKQFSNKLFVEIYKEFLDQMDQQFQKENEDRIQRLAFILTSTWIENNPKLITQEKKLPWNVNYKRRVKQIAYDLLKQFQPPASEKKQDPEIQ